MVDSLSELLSSTKLHCPVEEFESLRNNYNELFYYKNNGINIPVDFYKIIYDQAKKYSIMINLDKSYTLNSTINYKINILRFLFKGFNEEASIAKQIDFIYAIFHNLLFIVDN
jgi:hypothetical protein